MNTSVAYETAHLLKLLFYFCYEKGKKITEELFCFNFSFKLKYIQLEIWCSKISANCFYTLHAVLVIAILFTLLTLTGTIENHRLNSQS